MLKLTEEFEVAFAKAPSDRTGEEGGDDVTIWSKVYKTPRNSQVCTYEPHKTSWHTDDANVDLRSIVRGFGTYRLVIGNS